MSNKDQLRRLETLSERQREVFELICQNQPYSDIAKALVISESTVKTHMQTIYEKLGLDHLETRDEKMLEIYSTYCPLLQNKEVKAEIEPKPESIDAEFEVNDKEELEETFSPVLEILPEIDEATPVNNERELVPMQKETPEKKKKKPFLRRVLGLLVFLILLAAVMVGALYVWQNFFGGSEILPAAGMLQKDYYDVGEWVKKGDVWVRLREYDIDDSIALEVEIWNKSEKDLLFAWSPNINFALTDNTGYMYELWSAYDRSSLDNEVIEAGEIKEIGYQGKDLTMVYDSDPVFNPEVTELYLMMQDLSVFENVKFKMPIR